MLSILIPTYRYDVSQLVEALHVQALGSTIEFEILLYDDASGKDWNEVHSEVAKLPFVRYRMLPKNHGRSAIRNLLALEARYEVLLFMDGDSSLASDSYLNDMLVEFTGRNSVVGRTVYKEIPPKEREKRLRWNYGRKREDIAADIRQQKPYNAFKTHHFLISKSLALTIRFDEKIKGYGHEDTRFGADLKKLGVSVKHLDCPLFHDGLESNEVFLKKTKKGVENLIQLNSTAIKVDSKLWNTYLRLQIPILKSILGGLSPLSLWLTYQLMTIGCTQIRLLDIYKLSLVFILKKQARSKF